MIFIDAFFSFAAGGRHHLDGDAVIRQLRCGYQAALPRLLGNCIAVIGHQLGVDAVIRRLRRGYLATALRLFGPVRLVGHVGLRDGVCAPKRESGSLGRVLWWA